MSSDKPDMHIILISVINLAQSHLSVVCAGYREKRFAIVGVNVYAAGFYMNISILDELYTTKGQSDASLFDLIFQGNY